MVNPDMVAKLQHSVRINSATFKEYSSIVNNENQKRATIRGLLDFNFAREPVPR